MQAIRARLSFRVLRRLGAIPAIAALVSTGMLISPIPARAGNGQPPVSLSLTPSPQSVAPGAQFSFSVFLDMPPATSGPGPAHLVDLYEFELHFDPTLIQGISFVPGPQSPSNPWTKLESGVNANAGTIFLSAGSGTSPANFIQASTGVATVTLQVQSGVQAAHTCIDWVVAQALSASSNDSANENVVGSVSGAAITIGNPSATIPCAPTAVAAVAANAQASVSWSPPAGNGGSSLTGYTVTASPGGATTSVGAGATSATVGGLANGTPYTFIVYATNSVGSSVESAPSSSVTPEAPSIPPAITSAASASFTVGGSGSFTVTSTGTPTPTLAESGALPAGIGFNIATGVLSGTPAAGTAGSYPITFTASNGVSPDATQSFTLTVVGFQITTASLPAATAHVAYSTTLSAAGGNPPYKWSLAVGSNALPPGLKLSSKGTIAGRPTKPGTYTFTVQVKDTTTLTRPHTQNRATATLSITVS